VGVQASLAGKADITVGNIVGSNIFNVLFILGISAIVAPLIVSQQLVRLDVPLMIVVSLALLLMAMDGVIARNEGFILLAAGVAYTWLLIRISKRETAKIHSEYEQAYGHPEEIDSPGHWFVHLLLIIAGFALLVIGSEWLVNGAVTIASAMGVSELVISLTIIAAGTSLPEVATSIIAGLRGERDIAVGNVVGSNLFNILVVIGAAGMVSRDGLLVAAPAINFDIPVMVAAAVLCLPIFFLNYRIGRWEGALFLGYYIFYTLYLVLATSQHDALPAFSMVMMYLVIPLTFGTVGFALLRELLRLRRERVRGQL
jgi:cation:H+ antiporter